ncbi:MAG: adenylate/guanylate cyclase domain-containing protein [Pseudomonadota bacterium]
MLRRLRIPVRIAVAVALAAAITVIAALFPRVNVVEGWLSDTVVAARAATFGAEALESPHVLLVGMDERSLNEPELASTPRAMFSPIYNQLWQKIAAHGGKGFLFDIIMTYDAKDLSFGEGKAATKYDVPFLKSLAKERKAGRLVLGTSVALGPARRFKGAAGLLGIGRVEIPFGAGGVIRKVPTRMVGADGTVDNTLSGRALALLGQEDPPPWVNITPRGPLTSLPAITMIDLLRCDDPVRLKQVLDGRAVFLGGMLPGEDRLKTPDQLMPPPEWAGEPAADADPCAFSRPPTREPGQSTLPGVFIHAAAVDAVMRGWQPAIVSDYLVWILVFTAALAAALSALYPHSGTALALLLATLAIAYMIAVLALDAGWLVPLAGVFAGAPVAFIIGYGLRIRFLDRRENLIRREFGRYLSPLLVQQMIDEGALPELSGEERDVTVMFADLSGFTAASEKLESAELLKILNRYLDAMGGVIRDHGGYVDKYIGDAAMAIFNAPAPLQNHAVAAVTAAHEIVARVGKMAAEDRAAGRTAFAVKVGVATGQATLGNVGSDDRVNYTVVGETVNMAARLEGLPSLFNTPIVIGPNTAAEQAGRYDLMRICTIQVKGKTEGIYVFAPFDLPADGAAQSPESLSYAKALDQFESGDFSGAVAMWRTLAEADWPGAGPAAEMAAISSRFAVDPPTDWNGVIEATSK